MKFSVILRERCIFRKLCGHRDISIADGLGGTGSSRQRVLDGASECAICAPAIFLPKERIADEVCQLNTERLREPIGEQDQMRRARGCCTAAASNQLRAAIIDGREDVRVPEAAGPYIASC
jgi:hypothetical protein